MASSTSNTSSTSPSSALLVATAITSTVATLALGATVYNRIQEREERKERSKYIQAEIDATAELQEDDNSLAVLPSIISHFKDFQLAYGATIEEANKRRTQKYYELARDAHLFDLVPGVRSYPRLRNRREAELNRIFRYRNSGKSHRTVIVMLDSSTSTFLARARADILRPLNFSHDITTDGVWIPQANVLPEEDLHVTIAIPWWWHTIRENNEQLSQELAARFRQALVMEFHHAFQLELERIVLLGGKTLVALWRCVGEREAPDDFVIFDRHGEGQDPVVKLRRGIVDCFSSSEAKRFGGPLTYATRHYEAGGTDSTRRSSANLETFAKLDGGAPAVRKLERQNTIEWKTPGLGDQDGFIHTTLARLPIDCLSMTDTELEPIHRLCREATATFCGHRMVVSKFRFLETTGEGACVTRTWRASY
jgi:hypothetical protein